MSKNPHYGLFLVITFILILNFIIFVPNLTSNQIITDNSSSGILSNSAVSVTHPADIELFDLDPTNHTISWTLTDEVPKDYLGLYSFTNDSVGANPAGWAITEPAGSNVSIITEKVGHRNVLNLTRNPSEPMAVQIFGSRTPSSGDTLEFWVYGSNGTRMDIDVANTGLGSGSYIWLQLRFYEQKFYNIYNAGSNSEVLSNSLTEETWHHIRIRPTGTNAFQIWLDGIQLGSPSGTFQHPSTYTRIMFYIPSSNPGNTYVDAVDYSWVPGYYLNQNMNITFLPKDYQGLYSFSNDTVGGNPTGWPTFEGGSTSLQVIQDWASHTKVVDIYDADSGSYSDMSNSFSARTTGTVEFWVYGTTAATGQNSIQICMKNGVSNSTNAVYLIVDYKMQKLQYAIGLTAYNLTDFSKDQWHHVRIAFDSDSYSYDVWLDQTLVGNNLVYQFATGDLDVLVFYSGTASSGGFHTYLDAIDYSWAPGYFLNRNMNFDYFSNLTAAVFTDGIQQTNWIRWSEQVQVNYEVNGLTLGLGTHNVSLAFNDTSGLCGHDDISVTVVENPIVSWDVPLDLSVHIDVGIAGNGKADIVFDFKNTGTAHLMNINFTIPAETLPAGWTLETYIISVNQLGPNESAEITFKLMVPKDQGDFLELIIINVEAYVYELAEEESGTIEVVVAGTKVWDIYIWLIVIVGSIAAAGTTSFYVIHTRRSNSTKLKMRTKPKSATLLKTTIPSDFPGTYTVLSENLKGKINNLKNLTDDDREILLEYINELDEAEALTYLESLEKMKPD